jgi:hypothetical protein
VEIFLLAGVANATHIHSEGQEAGKSAFTKHFQESLFKIAEKGEFGIEIPLDEKEYKIGKNVIGIVIHNAHDEDVVGADIKFTEVMPDGQVIAPAPVVTDKGNGLYTVANLDLKREGKWELKVTVSKKSVEDSALFLFPDILKKRIPAGKYRVESGDIKDKSAG